ncbi:MAG: hypothetical protein M3O94_09035 [Actinomycetota bacterium]|nr:hypothetical protein [Actinomycetota bacterium]
MKTSRLTVVVVAVLLPLSAACSSSQDIARTHQTTSTQGATPSGPTTPSVSVTSPPPDDGQRLEGDGYSVAIPSGWVDVTAALKEHPTLDIAMGESNPSGFRTNFNVVHGTSDPGTIESNGTAIRREAESELRSITHSAVQSLPDRTIDGEAAIGQTSTFLSSGSSVTFFQYVTIHNSKAYPVTMTFATENAGSARVLLQQILSTWQWAS